MAPTGIPVIDALITIVTALAALAVVVGGFILAIRQWRGAATDPPTNVGPAPSMGELSPAYGRRREDSNDLHTRVALTEQGLKNLGRSMDEVKNAQQTERQERREGQKALHEKLDRQDTKLDTILLNLPRTPPPPGVAE